jgi:hypothetical protein
VYKIVISKGRPSHDELQKIIENLYNDSNYPMKVRGGEGDGGVDGGNGGEGRRDPKVRRGN